MWNRLAAKELVEGWKCLRAAKVAPISVPVAANGWQMNGTNRATLLRDAEACFSRARLFRSKTVRA